MWATALMVVGLSTIPAAAQGASGPVRGIRVVATANQNELVTVVVRFTATAPSKRLPVVLQVARGRTWHKLVRTSVGPSAPGITVRLTKAGRNRLRLVYGTRLRRHTAGVPVRVVRPWFTRVLAGGRPQYAVVDDANVLWVVSTPAVGLSWELRALNGSTGRRLAGPVQHGAGGQTGEAHPEVRQERASFQHGYLISIGWSRSPGG